MATWTEHPVPLRVTNFSWARADAWASQVIERNGKFYWYVSIDHRTVPGKAIGVAVANSPTGPFVDARGTALVTNSMTTAVSSFFDDIDPTVYIDDNGQAYLYWGNSALYYAKLKPNMTELDGPIQTISLPRFTEAPWVHKRGKWYYLSYATEFPERIAYAMSRSLEGPWQYKGILNELAVNSNTNHQAIIEFKGKWYFVYHNGALTTGGDYRRSVCVDYLHYNADSTLQKVVMTPKGVDPAP
jgi:beta-xylosidase